MDVDADTHCTIQQYLKLIQRRASGELVTTATYMRSFVNSHPKYKYVQPFSWQIAIYSGSDDGLNMLDTIGS